MIIAIALGIETESPQCLHFSCKCEDLQWIARPNAQKNIISFNHNFS
jgi:hypothetical protein